MMFSEFIYYIGYSIKKQYSLKNLRRLPFKVISIGNITVGGTGKTPAAIAVAEEARKRGLNPVILTRGYRGKAKGPCFVRSSQQKTETGKGKDSSLLYGDEPVLMAERLKDIPIVKCADRYEGGMFALRGLQPSSFAKAPTSGNLHPLLFILDDGFQHWKLHRDVNIVLINGQNPYGNRKMLPMGSLREPLTGLKRADIFVITNSLEANSTVTPGLVTELKGYNPAAPVFFSEHRLTGIRDIKGNRPETSSLKGKRVYAFCGLANPESFRQTVLSLDCDIRGFKSYRDHYKYSDEDMSYLEAQARALTCDLLITTEKDMVKLREMRIPENLLCVEISFHADADFFDQIFKG